MPGLASKKKNTYGDVKPIIDSEASIPEEPDIVPMVAASAEGFVS